MYLRMSHKNVTHKKDEKKHSVDSNTGIWFATSRFNL